MNMTKTHSLGIQITTLSLLISYCYYPALQNEFTYWDDQFYITNNHLILNPTWQNLKALTTKIISLNYHPLTMLSYWVNAKLAGTDSASPFILTNIFFHLLNTILVYFFTHRLFPENKTSPFITAIIFGLHPMHVESVAWISERKDVLYVFFYLLSLLAYLKYKAKSRSSLLLFSLILFICACLSKAMAVSLPIVLYLIDLKKGVLIKSIKTHFEKLPFFSVALFFGLLAIYTQSGNILVEALDFSSSEKAIELSNFTFVDKIEHAVFGLTFYLEKFILPISLSAFHPYEYSLIDHALIKNITVSLSFIVLLIYSFLKYRNLFFGLAFFFFTLVFVLQLVPVGSAIVAERYSYLPYLGLGIILASLINKLANFFLPVAAIVLTSIIAFMAIHTIEQVKIWSSHISLFENVVEQYPNNGQARKYLATGYWQKGFVDQAINHIKYAIDNLDYDNGAMYELLGHCYADKNEPSLAMDNYNKAVAIDSTNLNFRFHRALILVELDPRQAISELEYCKREGNMYIKNLLYTPLGRSYGAIKNYQLALNSFTEAIHLDPRNVINYLDRAVTYEAIQANDLALEDYNTALEIEAQNAFAVRKLDELNNKLAKNLN